MYFVFFFVSMARRWYRSLTTNELFILLSEMKVAASFQFLCRTYFRFSRVLDPLPWQRKTTTTTTLGNLSNHDGNAEENVTLKVTSKYFKLFRDSFNSFNLSNVAE